ncbi:MAG TPA: histidine kinase, partial [Piscinibacter sp.]|nr:histidine kinase [Piscinibacter sp.]
VSISWWRFAVYAVLLLMGTAALQGMVESKVVETVETVPAGDEEPPKPPEPHEPPAEAEPAEDADPEASAPDQAHPAASQAQGEGFEVRIGREGVRVGPLGKASEAAQVNVSPQGVRIVGPGASAPLIDIQLPKEATEQIRRELERAAQEARKEAEKARERSRDVEQSMKEWSKEREADLKRYERQLKEWEKRRGDVVKRTRVERSGEFLFNLAVLWILFSGVVKGTYKGRQEAEAKAAAAEESAEAEALKRQLVEARLNTMQAQVEPHFLFNTLASIDHLIETDPKRASQMQKNLIALLRATMPTMREAAGNGNGLRDLRREMAVVRPYLEILQVRMEERLTTVIDVPEGLLSAEFPPMIIQGLVENAIKHGLEPKPEGGLLSVKAQIVHGKLAVTVADSGVGFGKAATAGTGIGLNNIRERLQLLYGNKASLAVAENPPGGTKVTITVPYVAQTADDATMAA